MNLENISLERYNEFVPVSTMNDKETSLIQDISKNRFDELTDNEKTIVQVIKNVNRVSNHEELEIAGITVRTKNNSIESYFDKDKYFDLLKTLVTIKESPMPSAVFTEKATWIKNFNENHEVKANETDLWCIWSIVSLFKAEEDGFDFENYSTFEEIGRAIIEKFNGE